MNQIEIKGSNKTTNLDFVGSIDDVLSFISKSNQIIFVDKTLKTSTKALSDFLDERIEDVFLVDHAEENKDFFKAEEAYKFLTEKNINRDHEIVAIGGGALTDFAGYHAEFLNLFGFGFGIYFLWNLLRNAVTCLPRNCFRGGLDSGSIRD